MTDEARKVARRRAAAERSRRRHGGSWVPCQKCGRNSWGNLGQTCQTCGTKFQRGGSAA